MKLSRSPSTRPPRKIVYLSFVLPTRPMSELYGPGAAVGAAGHARGEDFVLEAELFELDFELVDDRRHHAFALGDRQAARGQGGAGHRPAADGGVVLGERHAVAAEDFFEPAAVGRRRCRRR